MSFYGILWMFLFCVGPYGGVGAAVASGIFYKIPVTWIIFAVGLFSMIPSLYVPWLLDLAQRLPRVKSWVERARSEKAKRFFDRYGVWGIACFARLLLGPYISVLTVEFFGVSRYRSAWIFGVGAFLLAAASYLVMMGGVTLFSGVFRSA